LFRLRETLDDARRAGAAAIIERHEEAMRAFWDDADVLLDGSRELQFALRFNLFHLIQATARCEGEGVPAKGMTGVGYEGHYFWDTEMYLLPFLDYVRPSIARHLLLHRWRMLPQARERAREL